MKDQISNVENLVIGSGPGGSITAMRLAESGKNVLLLEEGRGYSLDSCEPFSQEEMLQKYRNGGITVALGKPKVSYVEGSCLGGGSEVNAGLYHRTPTELMAQWTRDFQVRNYDSNLMEPYFLRSENEVSVSYMPPETHPKASLKLHEGASALGWKSLEVPRWFRYSGNSGVKQSMSETLIPKLKRLGGCIETSAKVIRIEKGVNSRWRIVATKQGRPFNLNVDNVFLCAGAIGSPYLLRKSGLSKLAGKTLHMHPTIKIVARFNDEINSESMGVPVHQVKEFAPTYSFGCSISSTPYLKIAMMDLPNGNEIVSRYWKNMAIYYSMVTDGVGSVAPVPFYDSPLVKFDLGSSGVRNIIEGMVRLGECLFAAGAIELYPVVYGAEAIRSMQQLKSFASELTKNRLSLMTIHLFSSCPMGEITTKCVTNSYGEVYGYQGLYVNDSSILCSALGVNPQGSVMALAHRNMDYFLSKVK